MSEKNNIITRKKTFNTSKGGLYPTHSTQENLNFRVYTPTHLAQRIFDIVDVQSGYVFDPCIGFGALTAPFKKHYIHGCDIDAHGKDYCDNFFHGSFMNMTKDDFPLTPDLVVMNPPFNGMKPLFAPEVFLRHVGELFGTKMPLVMIVPFNFRMNISTVNGKRYVYLKNNWEITSIMSCPRRMFEKDGGGFHEVHCEVIFFNLPNLKPHYFL